MKKPGEILPGYKTALVTGASSGIGRCYVELLAQRGYNVMLVSRDAELLEEVTTYMEQKYTQVAFTYYAMDLARVDAAEELFNRTQEEEIYIDVLINNAGEFSYCDIVNTPTDRIERIITLHDITYTKLCKLFGADMAKRGGGYILNMSSYSIWMPWPGLSLYSASKSFIKSFSVSFAKEMRIKKVYVTAVCPAGIATDLYGLSKKWQKIGLRLHALSTPKFCARRGLNSLFKKRRLIVPDWWMRLLIPLLEYMPMCLLNILRKFTYKWQK